MQIILGSSGLSPDYGPHVVALGIFDGVHLGHRALLEVALEFAAKENVSSLVYTFDPHPAKVLAPSRAPKMLEALDRRLDRIASLGFDAVLVENFNLEFSSMAPETFINDVLVDKLQARHVVVGDNFRFGKKAAGDVAMLESFAKENGFGVHAMGLVEIDGEPASSTRIRTLISEGQIDKAAALLGRPYLIEGSVVRGAGRGKDLGFATANLKTHLELTPKFGVYGGWASEGSSRYKAAINIGVNPTFEEGQEPSTKVEVHLLDYEGGPLYGHLVEVELLMRVRDEKKFDSLGALKKQVNKDIQTIRKKLS